MEQNFLRLEAGRAQVTTCRRRVPRSARHPQLEFVSRMLRTSRHGKLAYNFNEFRKMASAPPVVARARVNVGRTGPLPARASNASSVNKRFDFLNMADEDGTQGRLLVTYDDVAGAEASLFGCRNGPKRHISLRSRLRGS